jgi:hypothetical protein
VILNRRESATVIAGLRLLAGAGVRVPNHPHVLVAGLCDETEPEYDLRFDADEEYVRELIDRIDEMSLRGVKLCNRCTEKHPGKWQGKRCMAQCADCERNVERHFVLRKGPAVARRTSRVSARADERSNGA